jgi:integrase
MVSLAMLPTRCHILPMSKKAWPPIRKGTNHGKTTFIVDARFNGKGERKFFPTKTEAEGWALTQKVKRQKEGNSAFDDRELATFGWTVQKAISFALAHLRTEQASVTVSEATLALVAQKKAGGRSDQYQKDLTNRLRRVAEHFDGKKLAAITTADLDQFLSTLTVAPGTKNTFRRDIRTLWSFSEKRGWAAAITAKATDLASVPPAPVKALLPEQAATLLTETTDPETLAFHAIGLFAGLRVSEIKALDWRDVDLPGGLITVSAQIAKTRSRRLVPILPNLKKWLQPIAKASGQIITRDLRIHHEAARESAKITPWPSNAPFLRVIPPSCHRERRPNSFGVRTHPIRSFS